ncbi:MAG: zinc-dependent metalloprotease [Bacteroidetes bacterium]|nr:zinc-dependent metalloprotease [Bacteroidota bacterium]
MRKLYLFSTLVLFIVFLYPNFCEGQKLSGKFCTAGDEANSTDRFSSNFRGNNIINSNSRLVDPNGVIIIPVVFHVIFNPAFPDQYVSDERIIAQLNRLNTDFRKLNPDVSSVPGVWSNLPADMKFEFRMACISPTGAPTNGIERRTTTVTGLGGVNYIEAKRTDLGGLNAWPTNTYLNIWICDAEGAGGDGSFPWEYTGTTIHPVTLIPIPNSLLDGVILNTSFVDNPTIPERALSRVGVHEVGHWLGLFHTYNRGCSTISFGDEVLDTPPQQNQNTDCPVFPVVESYAFCNPNPNGVMFMNYMDQTSDPCKFLFTVGQRDRARSFFSQTPLIDPETGNPYFTRYPFLANYFGIKQFPTTPYNAVNNQIVVQLKNPACLPTTYTISGPATEVSHNNQQIVLSVPCNSNGTITVTATSGNYIDDYTFTYVNTSACPTSWLKAYGSADGPSNLVKDYHGNILFSASGFLSTSVSTYYNHVGVFPPPTQQYTDVFHYTENGTTNWVKESGIPVFAFRSGIVKLHYSNEFINGATGNLVSPPFSLSLGEEILAETSTGAIITLYGYDLSGNILLRVYTGSGTPTTVNSGLTGISMSNYNLALDDLVITGGTEFNHQLKIFHFNGTSFNSPLTFSGVIPYGCFATDNHNKVYYVDGSGVLKRFDPVLNITETINIAGFNNNSITSYVLSKSDKYTDDRIAVFNNSDNFIYVLNVNINTPTVKKILTTNAHPFFNYLIDGDDFYISGWYCSFCAGIVSIGNFSLPQINQNTAPVYIAKLNLQTDFIRSETNSLLDRIAVNSTEKEILKLAVSPNPSTSNIKINVYKGTDALTDFFKLTIVSQTGRIAIQNDKFFNGSFLDVSALKQGVYYINLVHKDGRIVSGVFTKL